MISFILNETQIIKSLMVQPIGFMRRNLNLSGDFPGHRTAGSWLFAVLMSRVLKNSV